MSRLIFDIGAHVGEDTELYLKKGFRVVAVEANPDLAEQLNSRFLNEIRSGSLVVVDKAISDHPTVTFFRNTRQSIWGTTDPAWAARNAALGSPSEIIQVQGISCKALLRQYGIPYYMKVDIEGADLSCVRALSGEIELPDYVSIESNKVSWQVLRDEFDLFESLGYNKFKIVDQRRIRKQRPPYPSREGIYVKHRFQYGSSGLFGEEVPGDWLDRDTAESVYRRIFRFYHWFGDDSLVRKIPVLRALLRASWYDTHAARD